MNIDEIKAFLLENKDKEEVKGFISSFQVKPTWEMITADAELNKKIIAEQDRMITKAVESFKNETLPKRVEEEIKKRGEKQPWEIEIQKLQEQLGQRDREAKVATIKAKLLEQVSSKGLPTSIVDFINDDDEEVATTKIANLTKHFEDYAQKVKTDALKGYSSSPAGTQNKLVPGSANNDILPDLPDGATAADYKAAIKAKGGLKALMTDK